ncbi:MAG TPA: hypothetical protein VIY72_07545 [Acidimicrobiales bacterium]
MLTDRGLGALRAAATLTHSLPGLPARVRGGGQVVAEVRRTDDADELDDVEGSPLVLSPCAFRVAVGRAMHHHRDGRRLRFLDLPEGRDPEVELGTPGSAGIRPGGLYRAELDDCHIWAFATSLVPGTAHELGRSIVDAAGDLPTLLTLGLRPDPVTEITLAFARTTADDGSTEEAAVLEVLEQLMARWTVHELLVAAGVERDGARPL